MRELKILVNSCVIRELAYFSIGYKYLKNPLEWLEVQRAIRFLIHFGYSTIIITSQLLLSTIESKYKTAK